MFLLITPRSSPLPSLEVRPNPLSDISRITPHAY
jgi:hypothetical protein